MRRDRRPVLFYPLGDMAGYERIYREKVSQGQGSRKVQDKIYRSSLIPRSRGGGVMAKRRKQKKNSLKCTIRVTERTAASLEVLAQMGNLSSPGRVVDKLVRERMYRLER